MADRKDTDPTLFWRDLHGSALEVGFGRSRVRVQLENPGYSGRAVSVLPRTCVVE